MAKKPTATMRDVKPAKQPSAKTFGKRLLKVPRVDPAKEADARAAVRDKRHRGED
jgi:hypothetical protein